MQICWASRTNEFYAVQSCATLETNAWTNWLTHIPGNGTTNCPMGSLADGTRFYRVKLE